MAHFQLCDRPSVQLQVISAQLVLGSKVLYMLQCENVMTRVRHLYDGAPLDELRELCGHLKKDMGSCDVPTLLLADLSFPEKAEGNNA